MQGQQLTESQKSRIMELLVETDLSLPTIAERVGCSKSAVGSFNRRHGVRQYGGNRSRWETADVSRKTADHFA
jgi:IS30 family transposase